MLNKKLEKRLELLEKKMNDQNSRLIQKIIDESKDEIVFNPLELLKDRHEIDSYEKLGVKYYFLKSVDFYSMWSYFGVRFGVDNDKKQVSPEFTNVQELYMWIIENYKEINNPKKEAKKVKKSK